MASFNRLLQRRKDGAPLEAQPRSYRTKKSALPKERLMTH
jgi:hypothetical protein